MPGPLGPSGLDRLAGPEELAEQVARVASVIDAQHPEGVTLVGVLKGAVVFLADLARALTVPVEVELVAIAPYDGAASRTRLVKDLDRPIEDRSVVLVTGIVDTGLTADFLLRHLRERQPRSLRLATLADKPARRLIPVAIDYAATTAPDRFLLGYGLDWAGRYRNAPSLWAADADALAAQPDVHIDQIYEARAATDAGRIGER